jgi:hypothetical protein
MQTLRLIQQRFLQAAAAELSAGRTATCSALLQTHAYSSEAQSSADTDETRLQRFFKTANVAAAPEVTFCTLLDLLKSSACMMVISTSDEVYQLYGAFRAIIKSCLISEHSKAQQASL